MTQPKSDFQPCGCCGLRVNTLTRKVVVRYVGKEVIYFHQHCYDLKKGARDVLENEHGNVLRVSPTN